jgi:hypothetical protein
MNHHSNLREALSSALRQRNAALRSGRSRRKDIDALRAAIGRAEVFLGSYPHADDARVLAYCLSRIEDIAMIVPGNNPTLLARLVMDALKPKQSAA